MERMLAVSPERWVTRWVVGSLEEKVHNGVDNGFREARRGWGWSSWDDIEAEFGVMCKDAREKEDAGDDNGSDLR